MLHIQSAFFCRQHIVGSFFSLPLVGVFKPLIFNVIIDMVGFKSIILSVVFFLLLFFISLVLIPFYLFSYLCCVIVIVAFEIIIYIFNISYEV